MTQERVANSVYGRHLKAFVLYNTPFAASIDNPTYGLPTECESFYGGTGSFPGCAVLAQPKTALSSLTLRVKRINREEYAK